MRYSGFILFFGFIAIAGAAYTLGAAKAKYLNPPQTDAEKALDTILMLDSRDHGDVLYFMLKNPWRDRKKDSFYESLFTPELLKVLAHEEVMALHESCNGKYIEGDLCGLGLSPLTCSQDPPESYQYKTLSEKDEEAIIHPIDWQWHLTTPIYRLVKVNRQWKLDGVDCSPDWKKFNM